MSGDRKATERELRELAENGTMAPNSRIVRGEYRVTPESTSSTTTEKKSTTTKKSTRKAAPKQQSGDTGVRGDNAGTDTNNSDAGTQGDTGTNTANEAQ